ncbi:MAG: alpha-galactosidase [Clostridiales bacterium]|nr:alpha-galactosidase [Clostridiales bacterium]
MDYKFHFKYTSNNHTYETTNPENMHFSVLCNEDNDILTVTLCPRAKVSFDEFKIIRDFKFNNSQRIFTNGYQSWTLSKEYAPNSSMDEFNPKLLGIEKKKFNPRGIWGAGDLTFHDYPQKSKVFYGYTYGYVREENDITLFGSLSERAAYTIITFDANDNTITFEKDLDGVTYKDECVLLSLTTIKGSDDYCFDKYFEQMNIQKPESKPICGYTTWYNYYSSINEDIVHRDLEALASLDCKVDVFQIDDGYERAVGDWLEPDEKKFPNGLKAIADEIHSHNLLAGLWLAPFAVTPKSHIYKAHPDWLVRDENGRAHYVSHNWGGFYALDILNPEVQQYVYKVLYTVTSIYGFDLLKLDFLYACSNVPIHNRTRAELMHIAMDNIRSACPNTLILACGVPLAPVFGAVDYCRIGADISPDWFKKPFSREDVSTPNAILNSVFRRQLDNRAFLSDPDVLFLREDTKLSSVQKDIIALINSITGSVHFVSDNVSEYSDTALACFKSVIGSEGKIISAEVQQNNILTVDYVLNDSQSRLSVDLNLGTILRQ